MCGINKQLSDTAYVCPLSRATQNTREKFTVLTGSFSLQIFLSPRNFSSQVMFVWADIKGPLTSDDHPWISCFSALEFNVYDQRRVGGLAAALKQHAVFTNDSRGQCQWGRAAVRTAMCTPHTHHTGPVPLWLCGRGPPLLFTDAEGWRDRSQRRSVSREL